MSTIPFEAVQWLMTDTTPSKMEAFNQSFGEGAAKRAIEEMQNPQAPVEVQKRSWTDFAVDAAKDVAKGVYDAPAAIASGLYEGAVVQPTNFLSRYTGEVMIYDGEDDEWFNYLSPEEVRQRQDEDGTWHNSKENNPLMGYGEDTFTGSMINDASQFTGAFLGFGKLASLGKAVFGTSKVAAGATTAARSGAASFAGFAGNEGRITDMLLDLGVPDEYLPDFLETDPNDSEALGRLKNVLEEGPLGVLGVVGVKAVMALRSGDKAAFNAAVKDAKEIHDVTVTKVNERIEADAPPANDLEVAQPAPKFPEPTPGFTMTAKEHRKIDELGQKLAANPDADIKGSMGWRNFDSIKTSEAASAEIAATAKVLAKKFEKTKGKPQTEQLWKMQAGKKAKQLAELTDQDEGKVLEQISSGFDNPRTMTAELIARENYALALQEDTIRIAKIIRKHQDEGVNPEGFGSIRDAEIALLHRRELAANVIAEVQGQRSNIARAMRGMQLERKADDKLKEMLKGDKMAKAAEAKTIDEIISAALDDPKPNLSRISKFTGDVVDAAMFYRINSMLSGVSTQVVNTASSGINTLMHPISQLVGGAVQGDKTMVFHATRQMRGMLGSSKQTVAQSLKVLYNNEAILDPHNARLDTLDTKRNFADTKAGQVVGIPLRVLMTADEFFKQSAYRGRIFADAAGEADLLGHKGADRDKFIQSYIAKSFDEDGAALRGDALLQAQRSTFTEDLGHTSAKVQDVIASNRAFKFVVPFVKTPLNVLSQGVQHFPGLGMISGRWQADMAAGGARRSQAIGKQIIGGALGGSALLAAQAGLITGSGPRDPRVRKEWLKTNKPYSFVITDKDGSKRFISYQRLEPLSYPLSLVADIVEIMKDPSFKDGDIMAQMAAGVAAFAENTVNKTFTQGISEIMELMTSAEPYKIENWLEKNAGSFVPNLITQVFSDDEMREIRGVNEALMSRLGMDTSLNAKRNALGEPQYRPSSRMDPVGLVGPDIREHDPVQEEITRLAEVHQSGFSLPRSTMGDIDLKDIELSQGQSVFDAWIERSSTIELNGRTLRQALGKLFESDRYSRIPDGEIDFTGENEKLVKKYISKYREAAKADLMRQHAEVKDIFTEFERRKHEIRKPKRAISPTEEIFQ